VRLALWIGQLSLDTRSGEIVAQRARVLSVSDFRRTVWTVDGEPDRAPRRRWSTNRMLPRCEAVRQLLAALVMKLLIGEAFTSV
jgi:hypothetical protein